MNRFKTSFSSPLKHFTPNASAFFSIGSLITEFVVAIITGILSQESIDYHRKVSIFFQANV